MGNKSWSPRGTRYKGQRFSSKTFRIGDLTVSTKHFGVVRDDTPPYDQRNWWEVTVQLGEVVYVTEIGGSVHEFESKDDSSIGAAEQVIRDLAKAWEDPDDYLEWNSDPDDTPHDKKLIEDFIEIANRFEEPIQEAADLISMDRKNNVVLVSEEKV